jgi:hypothetical protein
MTRILPSLLLICAFTAAAHAEPTVRSLASKNGAWVISPPELAADLNARIDADWKAKLSKKKNQWDCRVGYMTDALVSWRCNDGEEGTDPTVGIHRTFRIVSGKLVPFDITADVKSIGILVARLSYACGTMAPSALEPGVFISADGIELYRSETAPYGCRNGWHALYPALRNDATLATIVRTDPRRSGWEYSFVEDLRNQTLPTASTDKTPKTRFVAVGDYGVRDTKTGLVGVARQPTDEVNKAEAIRLAQEYRGGGRSDWRLPQISELADLATADLAHAEAGDCTSGKSKYKITPLIHLSCGLAWSLATKGDKSAAWGFISGTARLADPEETKNYRVLMVRGPDES